MNEEISVTLRNNTTSVQPVTLFTEQFAIPPNINNGGGIDTYLWDLSSENFQYPLGFGSQQIVIFINAIGYNTFLPTLSVAGLVTALNGLGFDTFTSVGDVISVSSNTNNYGELRVSPNISIQNVGSTVSPFPAVDLFVNGILTASVLSGTTNGTGTYAGSSGDNITVNYSVGAGAINWNLNIQNLLISPAPPVTIFNISGVGSTVNSTNFTYPPSGSVYVVLTVNP